MTADKHLCECCSSTTIAMMVTAMLQPQDKQEQLAELLNRYSISGLPKMPDLLTLGRPHYDHSVFQLERHWIDIVANHDQLSKRRRDQQEAVWELLSTEVEYIRKLRAIIDVRTRRNINDKCLRLVRSLKI